jgi:ankyrin repeat protein
MGILFGMAIFVVIVAIISFIVRAVGSTVGKLTETPLMKAAIADDVDTIKELLASGAPIDETNAVKYTALSLAVINNREEAAKVLIEAGADLTMRLRDDKNIFDFSFESENEFFLLHLIEKANVNLLIRNNLFLRAAEKDFSIEVLRKLLEKAPEGKYKSLKKYSDGYMSDIDLALYYATGNSNIKTIDFLLENGAGLSAHPILGAVSSGSLPLVKKFVELGDDIEAKFSDTGSTCLAQAVIERNEEIVEYLLENKANPNVYIKEPPNYNYESTLLSYVRSSSYFTHEITFFDYGKEIMGPLLEKYGAKKKF